MPTLIVDNLPQEIYEQLQRRASARQRSVEDETVDLLQQILRKEEASPSPRLPNLVSGTEIPAPCDLPCPGPATLVPTYPGGPRLPDPLI